MGKEAAAGKGLLFSCLRGEGLLVMLIACVALVRAEDQRTVPAVSGPCNRAGSDPLAAADPL